MQNIHMRHMHHMWQMESVSDDQQQISTMTASSAILSEFAHLMCFVYHIEARAHAQPCDTLEILMPLGAHLLHYLPEYATTLFACMALLIITNLRS